MPEDHGCPFTFISLHTKGLPQEPPHFFLSLFLPGPGYHLIFVCTPRTCRLQIIRRIKSMEFVVGLV